MGWGVYYCKHCVTVSSTPNCKCGGVEARKKKEAETKKIIERLINEKNIKS